MPNREYQIANPIRPIGRMGELALLCFSPIRASYRFAPAGQCQFLSHKVLSGLGLVGMILEDLLCTESCVAQDGQ